MVMQAIPLQIEDEGGHGVLGLLVAGPSTSNTFRGDNDAIP